WYWLLGLTLAGFGTGLYQLRGKIPTLYRVAQGIDRKLELADTLSTAFYFRGNPEPGREAICERQQQDAESKASSVDLRYAIPYRRSRFVFPAGVLALVAAGLFVARYAATGSLDLGNSMIAVAADSFFPTPEQQVAKNDARKGNIKQEP